MEMANIPAVDRPRVVIIGAGFGGLEAATKLVDSGFQIVLLDKNNYHQFQPLFYQVATAGLEPSAISFPLRRIFSGKEHVHIRVAKVERIDPVAKTVETTIGSVRYDYLIMGIGADTNYFGMENVKRNAIPMKSVSEALTMRNRILQNYEDALSATDADERDALMNIVVVGAGPTGVEVCGALAEMKRYVLPKDVPELNFHEMDIYLVEGLGKVLGPMSEHAQKKSEEYLKELGIHILLNTAVKDYDGYTVQLGDGKTIKTRTLIWAAGVRAINIEGLPAEAVAKNGRYIVDQFNRLPQHKEIFVVGDAALLTEPDRFPNGHPQVAQVAIQQGRNVARNLQNLLKGKEMKPFVYDDKGYMATIGRNKAVVDLPWWRFSGFLAWAAWLVVHLFALIGVKNKVQVFLNWMISYLTFNQSLRMIIRPTQKDRDENVDKGTGVTPELEPRTAEVRR